MIFLILIAVAFGAFYFLLIPAERKVSENVLKSIEDAERSMQKAIDQILAEIPAETAKKMIAILDEIETHKIPVVPSTDSPVLEVIPVGELQIIRNKIRAELVTLEKAVKDSKNRLHNKTKIAKKMVK